MRELTAFEMAKIERLVTDCESRMRYRLVSFMQHLDIPLRDDEVIAIRYEVVRKRLLSARTELLDEEIER